MRAGKSRGALPKPEDSPTPLMQDRLESKGDVRERLAEIQESNLLSNMFRTVGGRGGGRNPKPHIVKPNGQRKTSNGRIVALS